MTNEAVLTIKTGKIRGEITKNYDGEQYYSFKGIPYGKPPIGDLRFKSPLPAEPWEGVKDATTDGNECISVNPFFQSDSASEDCLYLNVYTRELPDRCKTLKPVMVWIHGGGFTMGSGSSKFQSPDYLMTKDVVIVSINYRVGLLGFLSLDEPSLKVPGNAGMKDQVLALKWVQENIAQFSGDPDNVTIFGVSAGGASVHFLMLSPLTKGLFHKCILQSGCALCPFSKGHKTLPYLTDALNMPDANEVEVLNILQKMSSEELIQLQTKIKEGFDPHYKRSFAPIVENALPGAFLTEDPEKILSSGNYNQVPIIIGFTSREGSLADIVSDNRKNGYKIKNFEDKIPHAMNIAQGSELSKAIAQKIRNFYYGEHEPSEEKKLQFILLHGDAVFEWPAIRSVKLHLSTLAKPIYLYRFATDSEINAGKKLFKCSVSGAGHGDDSGYIFNGCWYPSILPNTIGETVMRGMIELWTTFATTGEPRLPSNNCQTQVKWLPVDKDSLHYLEIGDNFTVGENPDSVRMKFWEEITSIQNTN